jgi:dipeptidyl aminopeptidase/acylaminoacyl peptidase
MIQFKPFSALLFLSVITLLLFNNDPLQAQQQFTFEDVLQFEDIKSPTISADGEWVAYGVWPEIGDGKVYVKNVNGSREHVIERGQNPQISNNGSWAGAIVHPPYIEAENAGDEKAKTSLMILQTDTGDTLSFSRVEAFEFSNDSRWLVVHHYQTEEVEKGEFKNPHIGKPVRLVRLDSSIEFNLPFVNEAAMDSTATTFAFSTVDTSATENGLFAINLAVEEPEVRKIHGMENAYYTNLTWDHKRSRIALNAAELDTTREYSPMDASIITWTAFEGDPESILTPEEVEEGYRLRSNNNLVWTHDGSRLFYGVMAEEMVAITEEKAETDSLSAENLYSTDRILGGIEGMVWHWDDPRIKTHEKETWEERKNHLYIAVYHLDEEKPVQLATKERPYLNVDHHNGKLLGSSDLPYLKQITWDGWYRDYYLVDQRTGEAQKILEKQRFGADVSPNGAYAIWFDGVDWMLMRSDNGAIKNLTSTLKVPFADEDNDRPQPDGSYGIAGWTNGDEDVLIYDKYDIWQFDTASGVARSLTDGFGREESRIFRIVDLDPEEVAFSNRQELLLTMYHDLEKNFGFYRAKIGRSGVSPVLEMDKKYSIVSVAEEDEAILFTQETYTEFPNLWVAEDHRFNDPVQVSNLHSDITDKYAWGRAELVEWLNMDGKQVQGVLIYPGNYEPGKRYPVFIYYYERFSQRLYEFNKPVTNHRPNFAQYASDGYAVFLPDIWFDVPIPGYSATKNLVPGVQKLVEMGIADPDAIGLHGHSWSGYLTAHVVTQTDIFAAAVAGAPVGNMTSAYSGIRWGSGLARQFQYEQSQSRLGVSMWENLSPYIENSPVFYADRINTPLMIQHGDADEAVPWYQSIELYLALRRLGKDSVFLHYYDEPHHLRKLSNRLDYAIKMKEYMDHYLKGEPAPQWITDGVPYRD